LEGYGGESCSIKLECVKVENAKAVVNGNECASECPEDFVINVDR
jgi:hypothetical protein